MQALRKIALALPETEEGIACKGTALETITVTVKMKAFLFLGKKVIRLKLGDSLKEATRLAAKQPDRYEVGALGWVKISCRDDDPPPLAVLARWVNESYRLMAPKQPAATMPQRTATAKKKTPKKKA